MPKCFVFVLIGCFSFHPALANDAKVAFESLYGAKLKQAAATADRTDDLALAAEMLAAAKKSASTPELQAMLCDAAFELGAKHPDGYSVAVEAMTTLGEAQKSKLASTRERLLEILSKQSRMGKQDDRDAANDAMIQLLLATGDEKAQQELYADAGNDYRRATTLALQRKLNTAESIRARMEWAIMRDAAQKRVTLLRSRLLESRSDSTAASELFRLLMIDMDSPALAKTYVDTGLDAATLKIQALATRDISGMDAVECRTLADWYITEATAAKRPAKGATLRRAHSLLTRALEVHGTDELGKRTLEIKLESVAQSIKAFPDASPLAARSAPREDGLIIHYIFEKQYIQESVLKNQATDKWHGKVTGTTLTKSPIGPSVVFDGRDDLIDTGFNAGLEKWSFALWVMGSESPRQTDRVCTGPLHREAAFQLAWHHASPDFVAVVTTMVNDKWVTSKLGGLDGKKWYHIAATYDGTQLSTYINGKLVGKTTGSGGEHAPRKETLVIGGNTAPRDWLWSGAVADFRLYDRALKPTEIESIASGK